MKKRSAYYCYQIIMHVAAKFGISEEDLFLLKSEVARKARMCATYLLRRMTNASLTMISEILGYDSPKEVLYAIRIQEVRMKQDPEVSRFIESACKAIADTNWYSNSCMPEVKNKASDKVVSNAGCWLDEVFPDS